MTKDAAQEMSWVNVSSQEVSFLVRSVPVQEFNQLSQSANEERESLSQTPAKFQPCMKVVTLLCQQSSPL